MFQGDLWIWMGSTRNVDLASLTYVKEIWSTIIYYWHYLCWENISYSFTMNITIAKWHFMYRRNKSEDSATSLVCITRLWDCSVCDACGHAERSDSLLKLLLVSWGFFDTCINMSWDVNFARRNEIALIHSNSTVRYVTFMTNPLRLISPAVVYV